MTINEAKATLEKMKGSPYWIDGDQEVIESYKINLDSEKVVITTDKKERRCDINQLGQHLKLYRKNPPEDTGKPNGSGIALLESLPQNANLSYIEESLIEQVTKLRAGNKEIIPIAESINRVATTLLNIQKSKIEMGKLLIEAHKNKV